MLSPGFPLCENGNTATYLVGVVSKQMTWNKVSAGLSPGLCPRGTFVDDGGSQKEAGHVIKYPSSDQLKNVRSPAPERR